MRSDFIQKMRLDQALVKLENETIEYVKSKYLRRSNSNGKPTL